MSFVLLWHVRGTPENELVQLPAQLQGNSPETLDINFDRFPQWDKKTDLVGFAFSGGTDVTMQEISFYHWNVFQKMTEAFKGFWVPDRMESYSINFLWGPLLVFNSFGRAQLFTTLPPAGWSVNRLFYAVIVLAAIMCAGWAWHRPNARRSALLAMLWVCAALWMLYDLRMGGELLHYAITDMKTYVSKPVEERVLRSLVNFHGVLEQSMPFLTEQKRYGLLVPQGTPLPGHALYATYPKSTPLQPDEDPKGKTRTWLVFYRPDVRMNEKRELVSGGNVLTPPGAVIKQFDGQSFLFHSDE